MSRSLDEGACFSSPPRDLFLAPLVRQGWRATPSFKRPDHLGSEYGYLWTACSPMLPL